MIIEVDRNQLRSSFSHNSMRPPAALRIMRASSEVMRLSPSTSATGPPPPVAARWSAKQSKATPRYSEDDRCRCQYHADSHPTSWSPHPYEIDPFKVRIIRRDVFDPQSIHCCCVIRISSHQPELISQIHRLVEIIDPRIFNP